MYSSPEGDGIKRNDMDEAYGTPRKKREMHVVLMGKSKGKRPLGRQCVDGG